MKYPNVVREKVPSTVTELNILIANLQVHYQKLRNFHWNVKGENFFELHELFEQLYKETQSRIDTLAERVQTLKYHPVSSLRTVLETAEIKEPETFLESREMVERVLEDHKIILRNISRAIELTEKSKDRATLHLLSAYLMEIETHSWKMEAWLKQNHPSENKAKDFVAMN